MTVPALLARASVAEAASDYSAVVRHLTPVTLRTPRGGLDEPGFWPWHDVYASALVVTGRLSEAEAFLAPARGDGAPAGTPLGGRPAPLRPWPAARRPW